MTVAVANRMVMLADTLIESGNTYYDAGKIEVVTVKGNRYVVATAGSGRAGSLYVAHMRKHGLATTSEALEDGFEALVLARDGVYHVDSGGDPVLQRRGWHCIGSGGDVALGAISLQLGTDTRQPTVAELRRGMQTAFRHCECGGDIDEVWFGKRPR